MKNTLKGITITKTIFLNGELLNPIKITKEFGYDVNLFDWGIDNQNTSKLAIAIMLKLNGKPNGYQQLKNELLIYLNQKENFDIVFELMSTARKEAINTAHAHNKYLTHTFLMERSDKELCCFIHPLYRDDCEIKLGLRVGRSER
jgi:hypothetical protein